MLEGHTLLTDSDLYDTVAKVRDLPLLFKGDDFSRTDLSAVV